MITYDIDKKQPKTTKKTILEARSTIFLSAFNRAYSCIIFYLNFNTGVF